MLQAFFHIDTDNLSPAPLSLTELYRKFQLFSL